MTLCTTTVQDVSGHTSVSASGAYPEVPILGQSGSRPMRNPLPVSLALISGPVMRHVLRRPDPKPRQMALAPQTAALDDQAHPQTDPHRQNLILNLEVAVGDPMLLHEYATHGGTQEPGKQPSIGPGLKLARRCAPCAQPQRQDPADCCANFM